MSRTHPEQSGTNPKQLLLAKVNPSYAKLPSCIFTYAAAVQLAVIGAAPAALLRPLQWRLPRWLFLPYFMCGLKRCYSNEISHYVEGSLFVGVCDTWKLWHIQIHVKTYLCWRHDKLNLHEGYHHQRG